MQLADQKHSVHRSFPSLPVSLFRDHDNCQFVRHASRKYAVMTEPCCTVVAGTQFFWQKLHSTGTSTGTSTIGVAFQHVPAQSMMVAADRPHGLRPFVGRRPLILAKIPCCLSFATGERALISSTSKQNISRRIGERKVTLLCSSSRAAAAAAAACCCCLPAQGIWISGCGWPFFSIGAR